ncbi:hypothetical protein HKX48_001440 [Thoreauomyces humboldtii]|nr:hypothetical protein HKX48_001440 [Thoreauomyces humboldtii]
MGGSNVYNFMVAFAAAMGGMLFGYEIGVIGQVLAMDSTFGAYFDITHYGPDTSQANNPMTWLKNPNHDSVTGNITMSFLLGCLAGALIVSYTADILGRKRSILIGGLLFVTGATLQTAAQTYGMLITGRVIGGLGIGMLSMVVPMFIAETAPNHLRGRMVSVQQLMVTIGIFVASCINAIIIKTSDETDIRWRLALGMQLVPGVAVLLLNLFMPFSPRWLANRDRDSEATKILARLRGMPIEDPAVQAEYREIKESIEMERQIGNASFTELLKPGIRNRVLIGFMLQFFQQWTGINFIMYYAPDLIRKMGFSYDDASIPFNIAQNFVNMVGTFPGMYLVERSGRRKLLMWGAIGMGVCQLLACLFSGLIPHGKGFAWLAVFSLFGFVASFAATWGPMVWVYQSEIFPLRVRSKGTGIATASNWLWNAVIAKAGPPLSTAVTFYVYLIFGLMSLLGGAYTYFCIPETRGKSLEDMDELFGSPPLVHHDSSKTFDADVEAVKDIKA